MFVSIAHEVERWLLWAFIELFMRVLEMIVEIYRRIWDQVTPTLFVSMFEDNEWIYMWEQNIREEGSIVLGHY